MEKSPKFPTIEDDIEKLSKLEKDLSEKLKMEGVPVDGECRISMEGFWSIYTQKEIEEDKDLVKEREIQWYGSLNKEKIKREKLRRDGEKFEILKTIIFNKFLGNDFVVVRSSSYDDYKNNVDNVILDKKTGNIICALDEVSSMSGKEYEDKKEKVLSRNLFGRGVNLKYGLDIKEDKIIPSPRRRIPIFYLAFSSEKIRDAIQNIGSAIEEKKDYEKKLFLFFLLSLEKECAELDLFLNLDRDFKESIKYFRKILEKIKAEL